MLTAVLRYLSHLYLEPTVLWKGKMASRTGPG